MLKSAKAKAADLQKTKAQLAKAKESPGWKKLGGGYVMSGTQFEGAVLQKTGKTWTLTTKAGKKVNLGRRASFETAEKALVRGG